jgi:hypothetical protein
LVVVDLPASGPSVIRTSAVPIPVLLVGAVSVTRPVRRNRPGPEGGDEGGVVGGGVGPVGDDTEPSLHPIAAIRIATKSSE